MLGWLLSIAAWVVGKLFGNPAAQPAPVVEGEKLGAADQSNAALEAENAQLEKTAAADAAASVDRVSKSADANAVDTAPGDPVNTLPGEVFRS